MFGKGSSLVPDGIHLLLKRGLTTSELGTLFVQPGGESFGGHEPLVHCGGFGAAGSLLQRRMDLPDASVLMLQGFAFLLILATEALRGRLFLPRAAPEVSASAPPPEAKTETTPAVQRVVEPS